MNIKQYELQKHNKSQDEFVLVVHLDDQLSEFANELGTKPSANENLRTTALHLIKVKYPGIKVTMVKVMIGGMLVSSIPLLTNPQTTSAQSTEQTTPSSQTSAIYYHVASGDNLWILSRTYNTTVDNIRRGNNLTSDTLQPNQRLIIPKAFHTISPGDYLSVLAREYNTTVSAIRDANNLTTDNVRLGQTLLIPAIIGETQSAQPAQKPTTKVQPSDTPQSTTHSITYTVIAGDSLSVIAQRFSTTTDAIRSINQLSSDTIRVGQALTIPTGSGATSSPQIQIIDSVYTVVAGDSLSVIAQRFGTTVNSLRSSNNLSSDVLQIGQRLVIPNGNTNLTPPAQPAPTPNQEAISTYTVVSGDSLSVIAQRFGTTVNALRTTNNLSTDVLRIGQTLTIPSGNGATAQPAPTPNQEATSTYTVVSGDSLSVIAQRFGTTVNALRTTNNLSTDVLRIGQTLTIPSGNGTTAQPAPQERTTFTYRVVAGDNLSVIASRHGVTVNAIRTANALRTDVLQVGQTLTIPNGLNAPSQTGTTQTAPAQNGSTAPVTISYIQHTIRSGDNMWNLSNQYGVPYNELLKHNNMKAQSTLRIGQVIKVPQYQVPIRPVVSARHGEVLDWWTEARYVFSTGKVATITDFQTGRQFQVKHTMGGNHADSEPLTSRDAQIMREIWGGSYSWTPRAIIVEVDGRKLAAAMHSMPHGDQVIRDNNYNGHFCIHFLNSQRHSDGQIQDTMQRQIEIAAGRTIR
ncbi:hypothetical protein BTR23_10365 [Alkalihalophilus pseudofirmus]|nr:hypothetical protein BTR23_10365 [Alkalihalophilus pseudofirmus]